MAMIKCPKCGKEMSDKAKRCPKCKRYLKKKSWSLMLIIAVIVVVGIFALIFGINQYKLKQQEQIATLIENVDKLYSEYNFEEITNCYDKLDKLNYDTTNLRLILEYDVSVYDDVQEFYNAFFNVDDKLQNGDYSSLKKLIDTLREPIKAFDDLPINEDSEFGKYINNIRNNIMYETFKVEFINSDEYDLDYGLTSWGYAYVIKTYTEIILEEKFPFSQEEK